MRIISVAWLHLLLVTFPDLLSLALLPHGIDLSQLWPSPGLLSTECPESPLVSCHLLMTPDDISSSCQLLSRQLPRPSQDHQPRPRHWRYAVWLVAAEWRHCSTGHGFPRDHCSARLPSVQTLACQPRPSHHQLYCLLYIYTEPEATDNHLL